MRILVDSSSYHCRNAGDMAMMLVAVERIREYCPAAEIRMVTGDSGSLATYFPGVQPVSWASRQAWIASGSLLGRWRERLPFGISPVAEVLEHRLWTRLPELSACGMRLKQRLMGYERIDPALFRDEIRSASLVMTCGMGAFNDAFRGHALDLLEVCAAALRDGVPVVLFGQGIGPITDPVLLRKAEEVLPRLQFIGLREGRLGVPFLTSLGAQSMEVTGDDAIELAYRRRCEHLGSGIGVNVRVASYAGTDDGFAAAVRTTVEAAAEKFGVPLIPVPISTYPEDSDAAPLKEIALGSRCAWDGEFELQDPLDVIDQVAACRVVIVGSYHAAVFALSQGIPAVCVENSAYYSQKFHGLSGQFGTGCTVVPVAAPGFGPRLSMALDEAWHSAEHLRGALLRAAASQIETGRATYARVFSELGRPNAAKRRGPRC